MNKKLTFGLGLAVASLMAGVLIGCGGNSKEYTITFDTNGGSPVEPLKVKWGDTPNMPDDPTKAGYTFIDWFKDEGLTSVYVPAPVETDFTLYAKWSINSYTVSFESNGGTPIAPVTGNFGSTINRDDVRPSKDYYVFDNWYTDPEFTKEFDYHIPSSDMTVFARWVPNSIIFKFDKNSGSAIGAMDDWQVKETTADKTFPLCSFYNEGYDFLGWATEESLDTEDPVVYTDGQVLDHVKENGKTTLYAVWEIKHKMVNYYVSYKLPNVFESIPADFGSDVPLPTETPELLGYTFNGWGKMVKTLDTEFQIEKEYFQYRGEGLGYSLYSANSYNPGDKINNVTLYEVMLQPGILVGEENDFYAQFVRQEHKIEFIDIFTEPETKVGEATGYYAYTASAIPNAPIHVGYTFTGWFYDKECTLKANSIIFGATDTVLYAGYSINSHKLTINVEETTRTFDKVEFDSPLTELIGPDPTKTGYNFVGWYTDKELTKENTYTNMPDSDLSLYAKFQIKKITVTYVTNTDEVTINPTTADYGATLPQPTVTLTKTGYSPLGWFEDEALTKPYSFTTYPSENITIYYGWKINSYSITFDVDGKTSTSDPIEYGSSMKDAKPTDPSKVGYNFKGWSMDDTTVFDFNQNMGASDITLKPLWEAVDVDVTIHFETSKLGNPDEFELVNSKTIQMKTGSTLSYSVLEDAQEIVSIEGFTPSSEKSDKATTVKGDGTSEYTIKYIRNKYDVTFLNSKLEKLYVEKGVEYGAKLTSLNEKIYKDQHVNTYQIDEDQTVYSETEFLNTLVVKGDTLVTVIQTKIEGLYFNPKGGLIEGDAATKVITAPVGTECNIPTTSRTGYTFDGWWYNVEGTWLKYVGDKIEMPAGGRNFEARWKANAQKITFKYNDGSTQDKVVDTFYDETVNLETPTRTGYTFDGWYEGDNKYNGTSLKVSRDVTFTAHWKVNKITFNFNANGGTGSMDSQELSADSASLKLNANAFTMKGNNFAGWATSATGPVVYEDQETLQLSVFDKLEQTVTLYAVWTKKDITYHFDADNGNDPFDVLGKYGDAFTKPEDPTKEGYTFKGWFSVIDGVMSDNPYQFTTFKVDEESYNLKAKWEINKYKVNFNADGGTCATSYIEKNYGETLLLTDLPTSSKAGYDFLGWFTSDGTPFSEAFPSGYTYGASDITLVAHYKIHTHTVSYYIDGNDTPYTDASGDAVVQEYDYGQTVEAPIDPNNPLQYFVCWVNELGQMYEFGQPMGDENVKLYAKFLPYTIYFYGEGAEPIFSILSTDLPNDITTLDVDKIFQLYIKDLFNQASGYQIVISAADAAASAQTGNLTTIVVYSNILVQTGNDNKVIMNTIAGTDVSALITQTENDIPVSTNGEYYSMIMKTADDLVNHQDQVMSDIAYFAGKASLSYSHNAVYEALMAATQGSADAYTLYATYATLLMDRSTVITQMVAGSGQAGLPDEATIKSIVSDMEKYLPFEKNMDFIKAIAEAATLVDPFEMAETIRITASASALVTGDMLTNYEANAYRPYSESGKLYFDGWLEPAITLNDLDKVKASVANMKIEAKFVGKANPVSYINVSKITGSTVTFTWNVVEGAYGYKVIVTVNDVEVINELVLTNQITVEDLNTNDIVKFEIVAVKQDEKGQIKEFAEVFTATSLVTGKTISSPSNISLSSEAKVKNYTHIGSADMGDDVASGDYFYQLKDGQTNNYIFFTGITYDFGAKTIEISDLSDTGIATTSVDPNNSHHILEVGSKIGSFILKVTDTGVTTTYNCSVYSTVTSVALGNSLARRENITIESNAKSEEARSATYLGDTKDLLSVGIAHISKKADSYYYSYEYDGDTYYNGVKFDIGAVDNFSSFVDKFDADYSFIDIDNSGYPLAEGSDYIMDEENDVFYFLNTNGISGHQIQVTMTPKADVENTYVNHTIPKAFKKADYSSTPLSKSYVFTLNDGVNVYDDVTLSDAMNTTASNVNILNDINVNMPAKSLVYKEYAKDNIGNAAINYITLMENDEVVNACVDIVDYTAEMTKTSGLKCWTIDNVTPLFHDVDGIGYSYSKSGTYAIKNAKWKQNWGNGQFIVVNGAVGNYANEFNALGLKTFNPFARYNQSENPLTINGNYFTVDGSNLPSVYAKGSSGVGSMIGAYRIQNIGTALFVNSSKSVMEINDLTINGNTSNLSASVPTEGGSSIAQQMTIASGGINGIRSVRLSDNDELADMTSIIVDSVNVNDCLIALYSDSGIDVNYAHVKNCWANGCYGWTRFGNHITSSFRNSFIEGSGGCAIHIDDARFEMCEGGQNTVINPFANLDMQTCRIENFVNGEEQWFKGYGMEIIAMQLKTTIDTQISKQSGGTMTILKEVTNPVTGAKSEMMNWVFFDKTNDLWKSNINDHSIPSQGTLYKTHPEDMGAQISFGRNYKDKILVAPETYMNLPEVPGIGQLYAEVDQYGAPVVDGLGNVKVVAASYLDANGEIPLINMIPDGQGGYIPMESCMLGFTTMNLASQTIDQETLMSNLYLYFRQFQSALGFQVQGMVQVFPVA